MNAFVTLVMHQAHYIKGALVMGYSLKLTKTKYHVVCMVTKDIFNNYNDILKLVFDDVILVPYIKYQTEALATKKQQTIYNEWKDFSFTKWNCLNLVQYNKVCFLDADLVIKKNIDHLFELNAPAGCFGNNWDSLMNYYDTYKYGNHIPDKIVYKGLNSGYVVNGHCVVLNTSSKIFNNYIKFMDAGLYKKNKHCVAMYDENALVKFMMAENNSWRQIGNEYNCIPWKNENDAYIIHFFNKKKAWQMDRNEWCDLKIWYDVWDLLCETHPNIKSIKIY
jgi:lipopolysaccharide biosynthesis glycosyltransferase